MNIRATMAVSFAGLLGVPVKVREDYLRPEWLVALDVAGQPFNSEGTAPHG
jgi:hypothetical protein